MPVDLSKYPPIKHSMKLVDKINETVSHWVDGLLWSEWISGFDLGQGKGGIAESSRVFKNFMYA